LLKLSLYAYLHKMHQVRRKNQIFAKGEIGILSHWWKQQMT
jgi:hypothetical protein